MSQNVYFSLIDIQMKLFKTEENADIADVLSNMASIYSDMGKDEQALKIIKKVYGKEIENIFYRV